MSIIRDARKNMREAKNLHEGKGTVYGLVSDSLENLKTALYMARKNKKMRGMIPGLKAAITAIERIE